MKTFQKIKSLEHETKFEKYLLARVGEDNISTIEPQDNLVVTEKIDGSNAQVKRVDNELLVYSHKKKLDESNTLNGFYNFVMDNKEKLLQLIPDNVSFFGEWLTPHHLVYPKQRYNSWYLFDAFKFDTIGSNQGQYLGINYIYSLPSFQLDPVTSDGFRGTIGKSSQIDNLYTVPIYSKNYHVDNLEYLDGIREELSNHSLLGAQQNKEEGIVVSDLDKLVPIDDDTTGCLRVKCVNLAFKEVMHSKKPLGAGEQAASEWANKYITEPRTRKDILELMDEGDLSKTLSFTMLQDGTTMSIAKEVYQDALKESQETPQALTIASTSYQKNVTRVLKIATKMVNKIVAIAIKTGQL